MQGIEVAKIFVKAVDYFLDKSTVDMPLYSESKKGQYINFVPDNLRAVIKQFGNLKDEEVTQTLGIIRDIGVLVADRGVTNAQSVKGKSTRVITVRKKGLNALKKLLEGGVSLGKE